MVQGNGRRGLAQERHQFGVVKKGIHQALPVGVGNFGEYFLELVKHLVDVARASRQELFECDFVGVYRSHGVDNYLQTALVTFGAALNADKNPPRAGI